jgi:hypothetical protein
MAVGAAALGLAMYASPAMAATTANDDQVDIAEGTTLDFNPVANDTSTTGTPALQTVANDTYVTAVRINGTTARLTAAPGSAGRTFAIAYDENDGTNTGAAVIRGTIKPRYAAVQDDFGIVQAGTKTRKRPLANDADGTHAALTAVNDSIGVTAIIGGSEFDLTTPADTLANEGQAGLQVGSYDANNVVSQDTGIYSYDLNFSPKQNPGSDTTPLVMNKRSTVILNLDGETYDANGDNRVYDQVQMPAGINWTTILASNMDINSGAQSGVFPISMRMRDADSVTAALRGGENVLVKSVEVQNQAGVAVADAYNIRQGATLNVAANGILGNDNAVDGDALTAVGDGSSFGAFDGTKFTSLDGLLDLYPNGSAVFRAPATVGQHVYNVHNDDEDNASSNSTTLTIDVTARPGAAVADAYSVTQGRPLTVAAGQGVLSNDSNPLGEAQTARLVGATLNGLEQISADGLLTMLADGSFVFNTPDNTGVNTYQVANVDPFGIESIDNLVINVGVRPGDAVADHYSTKQNQRLTVAAAQGVLSNDQNPLAEAQTAGLQNSTLDGLVQVSADGLLRMNADGSFIFATPDEPGTYAYDVQNVDAFGIASAPQKLTIDVLAYDSGDFDPTTNQGVVDIIKHGTGVDLTKTKDGRIVVRGIDGFNSPKMKVNAALRPKVKGEDVNKGVYEGVAFLIVNSDGSRTPYFAELADGRTFELPVSGDVDGGIAVDILPTQTYAAFNRKNGVPGDMIGYEARISQLKIVANKKDPRSASTKTNVVFEKGAPVKQYLTQSIALPDANGGYDNGILRVAHQLKFGKDSIIKDGFVVIDSSEFSYEGKTSNDVTKVDIGQGYQGMSVFVQNNGIYVPADWTQRMGRDEIQNDPSVKGDVEKFIENAQSKFTPLREKKYLSQPEAGGNVLTVSPSDLDVLLLDKGNGNYQMLTGYLLLKNAIVPGPSDQTVALRGSRSTSTAHYDAKK